MALSRRAAAIGAPADSWSPPGETRVSRSAPSSCTMEPLSLRGPLPATGFSAHPSTAGGSGALAVQLGAAYVAIVALLGVVSRTLVNRGGEGRHLATCRVGQWVDGYSGGDGAPCSSACVDAGGAYLLGMSALGLEVMGGHAS